MVPPASLNLATCLTIPNVSCEYISWKPFRRRETSIIVSRDPLAVRICCRPFPTNSPTMASCVAEGGRTDNAYMERVEKLVMMGGGGRRRRINRGARDLIELVLTPPYPRKVVEGRQKKVRVARHFS